MLLTEYSGSIDFNLGKDDVYLLVNGAANRSLLLTFWVGDEFPGELFYWLRYRLYDCAAWPLVQPSMSRRH